MGRTISGVYPGNNGTWQVDKWAHGERLRQRGFLSLEEAERWLVKRQNELREARLHGDRIQRSFDETAAHYLLTFQNKPSIVTETHMLQGVMPFIGTLPLTRVHDGTLAPFVQARLAAGKSHKTINLALGTVRRILNLAATSWRDENGNTWLLQAPKITMLPLIGHQREPRPISWAEQRLLLPKLPDHLSRMVLFALNTGVRDDVVCSLQWDWEIKVPELGASVFEVPAAHVKGRRRARLVVCNAVAQSVVETVRGQDSKFVFVFGGHGRKTPGPIQTMNNTAWQRARQEAGLGDLHVHDLRHTVGMRLREVGVPESTRADILWHTTPSVTHHYSMAQIVELHDALERIKADSGRWNKSLATLKLEQREGQPGDVSPPKVPQAKKNGSALVKLTR